MPRSATFLLGSAALLGVPLAAAAGCHLVVGADEYEIGPAAAGGASSTSSAGATGGATTTSDSGGQGGQGGVATTTSSSTDTTGTTSTTTTTSTGTSCGEMPCDACMACALVQDCKTYYDACQADPDCDAIVDCVLACPDSGCFYACAEGHPGGVDEAGALYGCIFTTVCVNVC